MLEVSKQRIKESWDFGASDEELQLTSIKLSENHTYRVQKGDNLWILRVTPKYHRNYESIESELSYILTLHDQNVPVSAPILSKENNFIVSIPYSSENEEWWGVLFHFAPGSSCTTNWIGITDLRIAEQWGVALAKIHKVSSENGFEITNETSENWQKVLKNIPKWDETHTGALSVSRVAELADFHPVGAKLHQRWSNFREKMDKITKTKDNYGVLHGDLNVSNFFYYEVDGGKVELKVFDFDQFQMNFFAADISVVYFGANFLARGWGGKPIEGYDRESFLDAFMRGYSSVFPMDKEMVDLFLEFRNLYQTSVSLDIIHKFDSGKQHFEDGIVHYVRMLVDLFDTWPVPSQ